MAGSSCVYRQFMGHNDHFALNESLLFCSAVSIFGPSSRTRIALKFYPPMEQCVIRLLVKFYQNPTVGLRVTLNSVKLVNRCYLHQFLRILFFFFNHVVIPFFLTHKHPPPSTINFPSSLLKSWSEMIILPFMTSSGIFH